MKDFKHYLQLVTEATVTNIDKIAGWGKGTTDAQDTKYANKRKLQRVQRIVELKKTAELLKQIETFPELNKELNDIKYINNIKQLVTPENISLIEKWDEHLSKVFDAKNKLETLTGTSVQIPELRMWFNYNKNGYAIGDFAKTIKNLNKILTNRIAAATKSKRGAKLTEKQKQNLVQGKVKTDAGSVAAHWEKRTEGFLTQLKTLADLVAKIPK